MSICDSEFLREFPRSTNIIEFPLCCNTIFFEKTRINSFNLFPIRKVLPTEKVCLGKIVVSFLASKSPQTEVFESCHIFCYETLFKLKFLSNYRFDSSIKALVERSLPCRRGIGWKTADNILCTKFFKAQKIQKFDTKNCSPQLSKKCFTVTTDVIPFIRVRITNPTLSIKIWSSLGDLVFCFFSP